MSWIRQEILQQFFFKGSSRNQTRLIHLFGAGFDYQTAAQCFDDTNPLWMKWINSVASTILRRTSLNLRVEMRSRLKNNFYLFIATKINSPLGTSCNAIKRFFSRLLHISMVNGENPLFKIFLNDFIASICKRRNDFLFSRVICYSWIWLSGSRAGRTSSQHFTVDKWMAADPFHLIPFTTDFKIPGEC